MLKFLIIFIILTIAINLAFTQSNRNKKIDSLLQIYKNSTLDSIKVRNLLLLEQEYENIDIKKSIEYSNLALSISIKGNYLYGVAFSNNCLGNIYQKSGDFKKALSYYNLAYDVYLRTNDSIHMLSLLNNIGLLYDNLGDYNKAIEYLLKSMEGQVKNNNKEGISHSYLNIGLSYFRQENYKKALEYYNESLKLRIELKDRKGEALCYNNIGIIYYYQEELDKVLEYFIKALNIYQEIGDKRQLGLPLFNIGQVYFELNENKKALEYFEKSLVIDRELDDKNSMIGTLDYMGRVYSEENNFIKAIEYQDEAKKIAEEINAKLELSDIYFGISETYERAGDYKNALIYYKKYKVFNDSLYSNEKHSKIAELQTKYDTEKKEKELTIKSLEIETQNTRIEKQNVLIYSFVLGFIVILIFSFIVYRLYVQKRKANIILANLNEEILQQKEEIKAQAEMLLDINKELEKLSIVASETDNAVIVTDKDGNIEWINDGFVKLTGYSLDELISTFGINIINASTKNDIKEIYNKCIKEKISVNYINKNKTKLGDELWLQTTLTPIINTDGDIKKLIAIDSDITELKRAESEIIRQKTEIETQHDLILEQKTEITDSINYAVQIQNAIFTPREVFANNFKEYFIFFKPRNIVSGDFYWAKNIENRIIIAVADCTGHGVPGAFMSMLGNAYLNEIISSINTSNISSSHILNQLRESIIKALNQTESSREETLDGMDISLLVIDKDSKKCKYSGANNPLYLIRKLTEIRLDDSDDKSTNLHIFKSLNIGIESSSNILIFESLNSTLIEFKGDKMPIGIYYGNNHNFTEVCFNFKEDDAFYLFSDGYADQFGGEFGKKFLYKRFKTILVENSDRTFVEQNEILDSILNDWMRVDLSHEPSEYSQVDDICIVGIKL